MFLPNLEIIRGLYKLSTDADITHVMDSLKPNYYMMSVTNRVHMFQQVRTQ
jgi:hypothetical protein